jgi:hypothetical protein
MSNVVVAKFGVNYKMKIKHMVTQPLTHAAIKISQT